MEFDLSEYPMWYEDSLLGIVKTRDQKKQKEESEVKYDPTNSVDN